MRRRRNIASGLAGHIARLLKNSLRGFLTSRREIARRETATFLHFIQQKIKLSISKKRNSRAESSVSRPPILPWCKKVLLFYTTISHTA